MTDIKTQGLVEAINSKTLEQADLNLTLSNLRAELENSEIAKNIKTIEWDLRELAKEDKELREQGKQILIDSWVKKFEALDWTIIQLNKKPWALVIEDDMLTELDEYRKTKTTITIDKKQLKEDIKEWVIIEWVYIKEDYSLVIKNK